jgi:hypothetical protein
LTRKFGRAGAAAATTERREEARPRRAGASARADEADIDADAIVWERARAGVREETNEETNARYRRAEENPGDLEDAIGRAGLGSLRLQL